MKNENDKKLAALVCQAWNSLDSRLLEPVLSDDYEYESFWVFETMKGKNTYLDYLKGKFAAIKNGNRPVSASVYFQEIIGKHIVVLNQCGNLFAIELFIEGGMIKRMWMRPVDLTLPAICTTKKPNNNG